MLAYSSGADSDTNGSHFRDLLFAGGLPDTDQQDTLSVRGAGLCVSDGRQSFSAAFGEIPELLGLLRGWLAGSCRWPSNFSEFIEQMIQWTLRPPQCLSCGRRKKSTIQITVFHFNSEF